MEAAYFTLGRKMDLLSALPELLPHAIAWANFQSQYVQRVGVPPDAELKSIAQRVGVREPERIRIHLVDALPLPEEPRLREAALQTGLLSPSIVGLTLGHSILVVHGHADKRLLSHEFRHVFQYETLGSIEGFLPVYLQQLVAHGYTAAPLEQDARAHEVAA